MANYEHRGPRTSESDRREVDTAADRWVAESWGVLPASSEPTWTPGPQPTPLPGSYIPYLEYAGELGFANDNLPCAKFLMPEDRTVPDGYGNACGDDDGRTMSASSTHTLTSPTTDQQLLYAMQFEMLTQDGSQENPSLDARADVLTHLAQYNERHELAPGVHGYNGFGVGLQSVGDLQGIQPQIMFHEFGGMGGRLPETGLQDQYTMNGASTAPVVSGGLGIGAEARSPGGWYAQALASAGGTLALGPEGLSSAEFGVQLTGGLDDVASLTAAAHYGISGSPGDALDFAELGQGMFGGSLRLQIDALHQLGIPVSPFVEYQANSAGFGDTQYEIGLVFNSGSSPWLRPAR
jgi:hypothetical protein